MLQGIAQQIGDELTQAVRVPDAGQVAACSNADQSSRLIIVAVTCKGVMRCVTQSIDQRVAPGGFRLRHVGSTLRALEWSGA